VVQVGQHRGEIVPTRLGVARSNLGAERSGRSLGGAAPFYHLPFQHLQTEPTRICCQTQQL